MDDRIFITLLRHGMTKENEQKKYLGWKNVSLSERGIQELQRLTCYCYPHPDLLLTSDLKRCIETARCLYPRISYHLSPFFREYHFGDWEDKTYDELKNDPLYQQWLNNPKKVAPPNGESFQQFRKRVFCGWQWLLEHFSEKQLKHIVLVTHGGVIKLLLEHFSCVKLSFWEWPAPYGCGYTLVGHRHKMRRGKRCTSLQAVPLMENCNG